jgi:hypothetical protein
LKRCQGSRKRFEAIPSHRGLKTFGGLDPLALDSTDPVFVDGIHLFEDIRLGRELE